MRPGRRRRRGTAEPAGHQKRNSGTARSRNCAVEDRNTRMRRLSARARSRRFVLRHPASPRVLCPVTPSAHFAGSAVASSSCAPRALRSLWFVSYVLLLRTSRAPGLFSAHVCSARSALSAVRLQLLVLRTSRAPRLLPAHVLCALCALRGSFSTVLALRTSRAPRLLLLMCSARSALSAVWFRTYGFCAPRGLCGCFLLVWSARSALSAVGFVLTRSTHCAGSAVA